MNMKNSYCLLTYGKTQSSENNTTAFKRYIGLANSRILAINPTKAELEKIYDREITNDPQYIATTDDGKIARVTFIVETVPEDNNNISVINRLVFTLHNTPAYSADKATVQIIDDYGNSTRANAETIKNKETLPSNLKIDKATYRVAAKGEADLTAFLKTFLGVPKVMEYKEGTWSVGANGADGLFKLENVKDYFNGDFSEIKQAIAVRSDNKVKLLYGVRSTENKTYQEICAHQDFIFPHWIKFGTRPLEKAASNLLSCKTRGMFANIDYKICPLQEWSLTPTNLDEPAQTEDADEEDEPMW
jgi:hypothetical protein